MDRDLLFGVFAIQMMKITQQQLASATVYLGTHPWKSREGLGYQERMRCVS
jgi:hypothetical protein